MFDPCRIRDLERTAGLPDTFAGFRRHTVISSGLSATIRLSATMRQVFRCRQTATDRFVAGGI